MKKIFSKISFLQKFSNMQLGCESEGEIGLDRIVGIVLPSKKLHEGEGEQDDTGRRKFDYSQSKRFILVKIEVSSEGGVLKN